MKTSLVALLFILGMAAGFAQTDTDSDLPEHTGDNFSLEGALALFKKSNSLEDFEKMINEENNNVNNLDLNNDDETDYIVVQDIQDKDTHVIVLSAYLGENDKQDIATIGIEKTGDEEAVLQIEGDTDLYAENTIVEPTDNTEKGSGHVAQTNPALVVVNVWSWSVVRYIYAPSYVVWVSPYRWRKYPSYWRPWKPSRYTVFYTRTAPHRVYYHRTPTRRVVVARRVYAPRRSHSTVIVQNRRGTTVVHKNKRGKTKVVKTKKRRSNRNN